MPSGTVLLRYWAAARAAAGVDTEAIPVAADGAEVGPLLEAALARHPDLAPILPVASVLVDGRAAHRGSLVAQGAVVEVLPPFAGG